MAETTSKYRLSTRLRFRYFEHNHNNITLYRRTTRLWYRPIEYVAYPIKRYADNHSGYYPNLTFWYKVYWFIRRNITCD